MQVRRITEALALNPRMLGTMRQTRPTPMLSSGTAAGYPEFNYPEFRDLSGTHDMARFHLEILKCMVKPV